MVGQADGKVCRAVIVVVGAACRGLTLPWFEGQSLFSFWGNVRSDGIGFYFLVPSRPCIFRLYRNLCANSQKLVCKFRALQRIGIADFLDLHPR